MAYTNHRTHTLADGHVIALVDNGKGEYMVELGLTGKYVQHRITGEPVPTTTHGCVYCAQHLDKAEEVYALLTECRTIKQADRVGTKWWAEHMDPIINSYEAIKARQVEMGIR